MRYSSRVKPISYLKANAAGVLARLTEQREPLLFPFGYPTTFDIA